MTQEIFIGWKDIGRALGGLHWQTVKNIARKYHMPIVPLNGRPSITALELNIWWCRLLLKPRLPSSIKKNQRRKSNIMNRPDPYFT